MHPARIISALLLLSGVVISPAEAQFAVADSAHPPMVSRSVELRPGALLPAHRIVAFYGNPLSTRMGILGEIPPAEMMAQLKRTAAAWQAVDSTTRVLPALHLIVTVAQADAGRDGMYRLRHGDALISRVAEWARENDWLLFLDLQIGRSSVAAELPRLLPWLKLPWVHLGIDPEFAMAPDQVPGKQIGSLDATSINHAVDVLAGLVEAEDLPPKILVIHRFTHRMVTGEDGIRVDPRVQVVIHMDGFGGPQLKFDTYRKVITERPVQFAGFKLFYRNDRPMIPPSAIVRLDPVPVYIQYQ